MTVTGMPVWELANRRNNSHHLSGNVRQILTVKISWVIAFKAANTFTRAAQRAL